MLYRSAPAHIRDAIREAAIRWETADGTPLVEVLDAEERKESKNANQEDV